MSGSRNIKEVNERHLSFEQSVYVVNKIMASTGKNPFILAGTKDFERLLPKLHLEKEGDEALIYVRPYIHAMPIYIRVVDGKKKCFIGDSQGWHWQYYPTRSMLKALHEQFGDEIEIILPDTELQAKNIQKGCVVFSILCLRYWAEHGEQFFRDLEKMEKASNPILEEGLKTYKIKAENITLLQENQLPKELRKAFKFQLEFKKEDASSFWVGQKKTVRQDIIDQEYNKYLQMSENILPPNQESLSEMMKDQHLFKSDLIPEINMSSSYKITIKKEENKYIFEVYFGESTKGRHHLLYDNFLVYMNARYPKEINLNKAKTIFDDLSESASIKIDQENNMLRLTADSQEELGRILEELNSPEHKMRLYQQGMYQQMALEHFSYEAKEAFAMAINKGVFDDDLDNNYGAGLFLKTINDALNYFIDPSVNKKTGVLLEEIGITNPDLISHVKRMIKDGKEKIVFSCNCSEVLHQIAIIIDLADIKNKKIIVIDSEGKSQGYKEIKALFQQDTEFSDYQFIDKKPVVLQTPEGRWSCGVQVVLNVLNELEMLTDRKAEDVDEWMQKILRVPTVKKITDLKFEEQQQKKLERIIFAFKNDKNIDAALKSIIESYFDKDFPISFKKFTDEAFDDVEKIIIKNIYAFAELLDADDNDIKKMPSHAASVMQFFHENQAVFEDFKKEVRLEIAIKSIIGFEINDVIKNLEKLEDKKQWLKKTLLSFNKDDEKWGEKAVGQETVEQMCGYIKAQDKFKTDAQINAWMNCLLFQGLNQYAVDLIPEIKALDKIREGIENKESEQEKNTAKIQSHLKLIKENLDQTEISQYEKALDCVGRLKKKIFICSAEGWAQIIKHFNPDEDLIHEIIKDYESSHCKFYISVLQTMHKKGKQLEIANFALNDFIMKNLHRDGYSDVIEAALFIPEKFQPNFFAPSRSSINLFIEKISSQFNLSSVDLFSDAAPLSISIIVEKLSDILNELDVAQAIELFRNLPLELNVQLFQYVKKQIKDSRELSQFLLFLPERNHIVLAYEFKHLIKTQSDLECIIEELPLQNRYSFVDGVLQEVNIDSNFFQSDDDFSRILEFLDVDGCQKLLEKYHHFITNGYVLAYVLSEIPDENLHLKYAIRYQNKIKDEDELMKVIKRIPEEKRLEFLLTIQYRDFIKDESQLAAIIKEIPNKQRYDFLIAIQYQNIIKDGYGLAKIVKHIPDEQCFDFLISIQYQRLIKDFEELIKVLKKIPPEIHFQFLIMNLSLIKNRNELIKIINLIPQKNNANIIPYIEVILANTTKENQIPYLTALMIFLPQEDRYGFAMRYRNLITCPNDMTDILVMLGKNQVYEFVRNIGDDLQYNSSMEVYGILNVMTFSGEKAENRVNYLMHLHNKNILSSIYNANDFKLISFTFRDAEKEVKDQYDRIVKELEVAANKKDSVYSAGLTLLSGASGVNKKQTVGSEAKKKIPYKKT